MSEELLREAREHTRLLRHLDLLLSVWIGVGLVSGVLAVLVWVWLTWGPLSN